MVAAELRRQIVLGELKQDDQLPSETALMERFGVSRPTLREAFRILESEAPSRFAGAGAAARGCGCPTAMRPPGMSACCCSTGCASGRCVRCAHDLEPAAARRLARRRTTADLNRLQEVVDRHLAAVDNPDDAIAADDEFHRLMIELCGNETLQVLTAMVMHIIREGDRSYADSRDWQSEKELARIAARTHAKPLELIRKRKADEAEALWTTHLTGRPRSFWEIAPRPLWSRCFPDTRGGDGDRGDSRGHRLVPLLRSSSCARPAMN